MSPMEQYIREYSASLGLNPDIIMQTVLNEGGRSSLDPANYSRQSGLSFHGGQEQSYGPFQLFMGGGVGNRALAAGVDPRDPSQAFQAAKFAMDVIAKEGLGQWHGWKGSPWAAHGSKASGQQVDMPTPDASVERSYDPRSDTPSSGRPTGSELPGQSSPFARHPPNPRTGTGGYGRGDSPYTLTEKDKPKTGRQKFGEAFGDAVANMGKGVDWKMPQLEAQPEAARADATVAPILDTNYANAQRQYLAQILAQLNQNRVA